MRNWRVESEEKEMRNLASAIAKVRNIKKLLKWST